MNKKLLTFVGMIMASVMAQVSADEVRSSILIFWNEEKLSPEIKSMLEKVSFANLDIDTTAKTDAAFNEFCVNAQKIETPVQHNGNTDIITLKCDDKDFDIKIAVTTTDKGLTVKAFSNAAADNILWSKELPIQPAAEGDNK